MVTVHRFHSTFITMSQPPPQPPSIPVSFNRMSMGVSLLFCINIVCMPLKCYFTELLWTNPETFRPPAIFPEVASEFNRSTAKRYVAQLQLVYNNTTIPAHRAYHYDATHDVDVMRTVMTSSDCDRPPLQLLNDILGIVYFSTDLKLDLVDRLCTNASQDVARLWRVNFIDSPAFISALWVVSGQNDLDSNNSTIPTDSNVTTVYVLFIPDVRTMSWRYTKLAWRLLLCLSLAVLIVTSYICPLWQLKGNLERYAVVAPSPVSQKGSNERRRRVVRYNVVVGEPSCFVLTKPWVCIAFAADLLASTLYVAQACLRVCQTTSLLHFALGTLYLGRTVWFSYTALASVNVALKRWQKCHWIRPANTTVLAIAAGVVGGTITNVQGQWPPILQVYTWLFMLHSRQDTNQTMQMDSIFVNLVFAMTMCYLPAGVVGGRAVCRRLCTVYRRPHVVMAETHLVFHGGSIATLFALHPSFQAHCTLDQRGGDCYVCGFDATDVMVTITRVACIRGQLDMTRVTIDSDAPANRVAVGSLTISSANGPLVVTFRRGVDDCLWMA
ncbi:hypothetical protein DYB37_011065 [Aphanomyces astaci]|uniref:Uncharacterized protein n=1 Tax=Aphanomyces astaci TaxID=112090 RepID=A0A3R7C977_APHAT|nr:hypothetical protein DYB35_010771 [Aphanomyces astaci]RHZ19012.1 hypothetical protein DYB37_011065 [Aphanomyces astaci]